MTLKINLNKGKFDLSLYWTKEIDEAANVAVRQWQQAAPPIIKRNIKALIAKGISPVKGQGSFVPYSESYKKQIKSGRYPGKKIRPINLKLSGKMLRSLISRTTQTGFSIYFTNKLARIHSLEGAGASQTIRKVMPQDDEVFKRTVMIESDTLIEKTLKEKFINIF